ncbi:MAG: hypothetical protein AB2A00_10430 [Myxococcota bacterium]
MKRIPFALSLLLALCAVVAVAQTEEGVFSAEGVQIHSDARIYTLFTMLNDRGLDREAERGPLPTEAPRYHPLRQRVREKLKVGQDAQKQADAFLAGHQDPVVRYVRAALSLEDAPKFDVPEGESLDGYEGLGKVLAAYWSAGAGEAYDNDVVDYRKVFREVLPKLDALTTDVRKALKMGGGVDEQFEESEDSARVVVIYNPLDAHGTQLRHATKAIRYVVLGPWKQVTDKGVLDAVLVEFVSTLVGPDVAKLAGSADAQAVYTKAGGASTGHASAASFLTEGLSQAVVRKVLKRPLVLRTGTVDDPALPLAAEFDRALEHLAASPDKLLGALPGMLQVMLGVPVTTGVDGGVPMTGASPDAGPAGKAPPKGKQPR